MNERFTGPGHELTQGMYWWATNYGWATVGILIVLTIAASFAVAVAREYVHRSEGLGGVIGATGIVFMAQLVKIGLRIATMVSIVAVIGMQMLNY